MTAPAPTAEPDAPPSPPPTPPAAAPHVNRHGTVSGIDATARTFVVDDTTVRVTDTTVITDTDDATQTFADIENGMVAHVKGPMDAGVLVANTVSIREVVHVREEDFTGTVTAIAGACPAATFTIASGLILATAETEYQAGGACAEVATSSVITGRGVVQTDGSIVASRLRVDSITPMPTPVHETDFSGIVTAASGSCPARSFTIDTGIITVSAATNFPGTSCGDVTIGSLIVGRGALQNDGSIVATQLRVKESGGSGPAHSLQGAATSVTGSCPSLIFMVAGQRVQTTADTNFIGSGDCSLIVNGKAVEVTGTLSGGPTEQILVAARVKVSK